MIRKFGFFLWVGLFFLGNVYAQDGGVLRTPYLAKRMVNPDFTPEFFQISYKRWQQMQVTAIAAVAPRCADVLIGPVQGPTSPPPVILNSGEEVTARICQNAVSLFFNSRLTRHFSELRWVDCTIGLDNMGNPKVLEAMDMTTKEELDAIQRKGFRNADELQRGATALGCTILDQDRRILPGRIREGWVDFERNAPRVPKLPSFSTFQEFFGEIDPDVFTVPR